MNCNDWEERIALYAGGDLDAAQNAEVEHHLAECGGCRIFAGGMKESLALLRSAHDDPIAAGHYTAMRAGVLAQLATERPLWRRWIWLSALAAGLVLAMAFLATRPIGTPPVHLADLRPPKTPAAPPSPVQGPVRALRVRARRTVASVGRVPGPAPLEEPLLVKLVTDDPDIVIYWIADKRGEDK
jgi:anti-sigma factor RsiW